MIGIALIPALFIVFAVCMLLQIFLSMTENRWSGLIIPAVWCCIAVASTVYQVHDWLLDPGNRSAGIFGPFAIMAVFFFTYNIPTAIFLLVYFVCRKRKGRKKALEKMNIQDL